MTSKIAAVANLALHTFLQYSSRNTLATTNVTMASDDLQPSDPVDPNSDILLPQSDLNLISSDSFQKLTSSVRSLTPKDVGFDTRWISDSNVYAAPVAYVHITENETFSMGMFILRPGSRIPLHDHPGMFGVLRVIHGSVRCRSFSRLENAKPTTADSLKAGLSQFSKFHWQPSSDFILVRPYHDVVLTSESPAHVLGPRCGNLHEITPVDSPAVFLDILAPPYDHDLGTRECRFYKEIDLPYSLHRSEKSDKTNGTHSSLTTSPITNNSDLEPGILDDTSVDASTGANIRSPVIYLVETNQPKDYWCESAEYVGPSVV